MSSQITRTTEKNKDIVDKLNMITQEHTEKLTLIDSKLNNINSTVTELLFSQEDM